MRGGCARRAWPRKRPAGYSTAAALSELLAARQNFALNKEEIDVVVPVPHYWLERVWRTHLAPDGDGPGGSRVHWAEDVTFAAW